jgi:gamma-glutamyltranspeptidase / glutathione hydrolase
MRGSPRSNFGTMSFGEVASAAIRFAREGFPMYPLMSEFIGANTEYYAAGRRARRCSCRAAAAGAGQGIRAGRSRPHTEVHGRRGAARGAAQGSQGRAARPRATPSTRATSRAVTKWIAEGGRPDALRRFRQLQGEFRADGETRFEGIDVHACGAWSQGPALPMALNILKGYDLKAHGPQHAEYIHVVTEALKLAFADRHQHFGDPKFVKVPITGLMSDKYAEWRRSLISARQGVAGNAARGRTAHARPRAAPLDARAAARRSAGPGRYVLLCVIDKDGNAFSATPSDGSDKTPIVPGVGILCSGRGTQSWADPTHPCSVAPGKRPRLTPNPALAFKNGKVYMPFGTPGGDVQPQAMLQVFLNINVFGMSAQDASRRRVSPPTAIRARSSRIRISRAGCISNRASTRPPATRSRRRGHKVYWWDDMTWLAGRGVHHRQRPQERRAARRRRSAASGLRAGLVMRCGASGIGTTGC